MENKRIEWYTDLGILGLRLTETDFTEKLKRTIKMEKIKC